MPFSSGLAMRSEFKVCFKVNKIFFKKKSEYKGKGKIFARNIKTRMNLSLPYNGKIIFLISSSSLVIFYLSRNSPTSQPTNEYIQDLNKKNRKVKIRRRTLEEE